MTALRSSITLRAHKPKHTMSQQVTRWCFTLNNPTDDETRALTAAAILPAVTYLVFGRETGESGTPHLQGFVIFKRSKRIASVKRFFGSTRYHLEVAHGTNKQASDYCKKEGSFEEFGILPGPVGKTSRFDDLKEWVLEQPVKPCAREVANAFPSLFLQYGRVMEWIDHIYPVPELGDVELRPHQDALERELDADANDREIIFVVDNTGGTGKSWFVKYMLRKRPNDVQRLSIGKRDDLAYAIDESKSVFLFDIPRSQSEYLQYSILEQLKDGMIFSTKYQSRSKSLNRNAHVVVFMNEQPDRNALSQDRYKVINWLNI